MKKIKNIICFLISIIILITYIIAMEHINYLDNYNSFRLYWIINIVCLIMITANLLLYKCLQNRREQNGKNN